MKLSNVHLNTRRAWLVMFVLSCAPALAQDPDTAGGLADKPVQIPETLVKGAKSAGLTSRSTEESRIELDRVPGGTTVIDQEQILSRAHQSVEEVLDFVPGVYAESFGVGPEALISIRGAGILQAGALVTGVRILRDGLPITRAQGHASVEQIDLLNIDHVEVYKGAYALEYGASTLGGAINFISPTGYTADRFRIGMRGGSHNYVRPYLSSGGVIGSFDYYVSTSGYVSDGFRERDDFTRTPYVSINIGYRWTDRHETRFFFDWSRDEISVSGALTQKELEDDPNQVTAASAKDSSLIFPFYRVALKHTAILRERDRLEIAAFSQLPATTDIEQFNVSLGFKNKFEDVGYSLRHEIYLPAWGRENRVVWGLLYNNGEDRGLNFFEATAQGFGPLSLREDHEAENVEFFVQDQFALTNSLTLVPGLQVAYSKREQRNLFPAPRQIIKEDYTGISPKFGVLWQANEVVQLFGNVSRSFEPPITGFGPNFVNVDSDTGEVTKLDAQRATTIEVGTRGRASRVRWELAVYHSWVDNELLFTQPDPDNRPDFFINSNADTLHTGVEFGLEAVQPLGWLADNDRLRARCSFRGT